MWQYELVGMAAAIWPALFCLIAPPSADTFDDVPGTNSGGPGYTLETWQEPFSLDMLVRLASRAGLKPRLKLAA